jgi:hypothetical protein
MSATAVLPEPVGWIYGSKDGRKEGVKKGKSIETPNPKHVD